MLIGLGAGFPIIGSRYSPGHAAAAGVLRPQPDAAPLDRPREDEEAEALLRELGVEAGGDAGRDLARREVLRNPSNAELGAR